MIRRACIVVGAALCLTGCSFSQEFANTATPLATQISDEIHRLGSAEQGTRSDVFVTTVQAGDRDNAMSMWFEVPGVRDDYVTLVSNDPKLSTLDGAEVKGILLRNAQTMDNVLAVKPKDASK